MTSFVDAVEAYNEKLSKLTIQERVVFEMKTAMKNKNSRLRDFLRVVMGEFTREGKELTNEQALAVIKIMHKDALLMENEYEIAVLKRYLPVALEPTQIKVLVTGIINKNGYSGMQDMGKVMAELKKTAGVDMKLAGQLTKELL